MKLLDTYLVREILSPFLFGIAAFTSIISGSSVLFQLVSKAIKYGFPWLSTVQLLMYQLPAIISITLPMAILLATILVIGRLSSNLEVLALRSSGVHIFRILVPILSVALMISLINIIFNEIVVPKANYHGTILSESLKKTSISLKEAVNLTQYDETGSPLRIINVREINDTLLKDITIAEYDAGRLSRVIRSKTGEWDAVGGWVFFDGIMHVFTEKNYDELMMINFKKEMINLKLNPYSFLEKEKDVDEMSARELRQFIDKQILLGNPVQELWVDYYVKFAMPFACLIFSIIGAAVSFQPHRSNSAVGMGVSIIIILSYYIIYSLSLVLGIGEFIPPVLAAWLPNIIVGVVGMILLNKLALQ